MDILNKDKLKQVLEKWKGHPSITDLMDRFDKLQTYTKKKFEKKPKYDLIELHDIDVKEDPVRPELTLEFRQKYGRKIYGLKDEEGDIAAIMCFAFTHDVPKTVEEMDRLSYDAAMQATHRYSVSRVKRPVFLLRTADQGPLCSYNLYAHVFLLGVLPTSSSLNSCPKVKLHPPAINLVINL